MSKCKCKTYKCKAHCCMNIPMPFGMLQLFADKIIRPVLTTTPITGRDDFPESEVPFTSYEPGKNYCPFLRMDYKCNIYEERPKICRVFGDGTDPLLTCPYLKK